MAQYEESTSEVVDTLQNSGLSRETSSAIENLLIAGGSEDTFIQDYDGTPPDEGTTILNVGENAPPLTGDPGPPVIIMHPNAPGAQLTLGANTGQDRIIVAGSGDDNISVGDNSPASSNQSMVVADSDNDNITIETGGGNDTIETGDGNDMVTITGSGDNTVSTGDGDDTVNMLGGGNDTVDTGGGNDTVIITGPGDGSVSTGDGNDTITVTGSGTYTIDTGDGEDTLVVETDQGEYTIIDPDGPDLLTPSGDDLLGSIIDTELGSEDGEVNSLIFNTLSARLDQMIDNETYSKLSASIAMSAFSTVINDATEISSLTDAVEDANNALFAEAADQYTIEDHGFAFEEVPLVGIDGTQYVIHVATSE
jgi:Ca2+-binding RTX toxin-like protein